jgi:replicative DNA helicase
MKVDKIIAGFFPQGMQYCLLRINFRSMKPSLKSKIESLLSAQEADEALLLEQLRSIVQTHIPDTEEPLPEAKPWTKVIEDLISFRKAQDGSPEVFFSGWTNLDQALMGFRRGDLVIVGGRPAMGKTLMLVTLAYKMANAVSDAELAAAERAVDLLQVSLGMVPVKNQKASGPVSSLFCSAYGSELNFSTLLYYLLVNKNVPYDAGNDIEFLQEMQAKLSEFLRDRKLDFVRPKSFHIDELMQILEQEVVRNNYEAIFIESLQDLSTDPSIKFREQQLEHICRRLKQFARKHRIVVFVGSQLSRGAEARYGEKRPQLQDLRHSGAIEQYADTVLMLYRPAYYGLTEDSEGRPTHGVLELIIAKGGSATGRSVFLQEEPKRAMYRDYNPDMDYITLSKSRLREIDDSVDDIF